MAIRGIAITGIKELDDVLTQLPLQVEHRVLQQAHMDAAKVLVDKAKLLAPEGPTGGTVDSIGTEKPSFNASDGIGQVHVGPRRGRFKGQHAHLIEFGTKSRRTKSGANRGVMPKHPFMEPAFEATSGEVLERVRVSIARKILVFMRRTLKK